MPGPSPVPVSLSPAQRSVLERVVNKPTSAARDVLRANIILTLDEGKTVSATARECNSSNMTVRKWRDRFLENGLDGLVDAPRPGQPRKISDAKVKEIVLDTLQGPDSQMDTHWTTRAMAKKVGVSQSRIVDIWHAFGLKPHRVETWKLSTDPDFVDKVRDIVGLYLSPPENALVLCVDEKSSIQALDRTAPILPLMTNTPARMTHDYTRHGTTSLFAAFDIITGNVIARNYRRHTHKEFLRFLKEIDQATPPDLDLHIVLDNYATHKTEPIKKWLQRNPRFHLHFTPTSSSWLNLVERWFAEITRRKLQRSTHKSVVELERCIVQWVKGWNKNPRPFVWTKTADEILESLALYCQRINHSEH